MIDMTAKDQYQSKIIELLTALKSSPSRDPQRAETRRKTFLGEAQMVKDSVSEASHHRLYPWKNVLISGTVKSRREGYSIMNVAMLVIVVLGMVFGGSGVTYAAAQGSLPGDVLYPVKLLSEQVRMRITDSPMEAAQFALELANRRVEEVQTMLQAGEKPDVAAELRLWQQLENCLNYALGLAAAETREVFLQVQTQLRQREQEVARLQLQDDPALLQSRDRIRQMLQTHVSLAEMGVADPEQLQEELHLRKQNRQNQTENELAPAPYQYQNSETNGNGPGSQPGIPQTEKSPLSEAGEPQNAWTDETPTPGSGYGPGDPNNPWTDLTPTPGSGYGPGPGPEPSCTPQSNTPSGNGTPSGTGGNSPTDPGGFGAKP